MLARQIKGESQCTIQFPRHMAESAAMKSVSTHC